MFFKAGFPGNKGCSAFSRKGCLYGRAPFRLPGAGVPPSPVPPPENLRKKMQSPPGKAGFCFPYSGAGAQAAVLMTRVATVTPPARISSVLSADTSVRDGCMPSISSRSAMAMV